METGVWVFLFFFDLGNRGLSFFYIDTETLILTFATETDTGNIDTENSDTGNRPAIFSFFL